MKNIGEMRNRIMKRKIWERRKYKRDIRNKKKNIEMQEKGKNKNKEEIMNENMEKTKGERIRERE